MHVDLVDEDDGMGRSQQSRMMAEASSSMAEIVAPNRGYGQAWGRY